MKLSSSSELVSTVVQSVLGLVHGVVLPRPPNDQLLQVMTCPTPTSGSMWLGASSTSALIGLFGDCANVHGPR